VLIEVLLNDLIVVLFVKAPEVIDVTLYVMASQTIVAGTTTF
jgi:hypothetical protein